MAQMDSTRASSMAHPGNAGLAKFSMQGLLRGDNAARATFYASGITNGWLTRNEARRLEDLNPIEGLGEPLLPLNMSTQNRRDALLAPGGT